MWRALKSLSRRHCEDHACVAAIKFIAVNAAPSAGGIIDPVVIIFDAIKYYKVIEVPEENGWDVCLFQGLKPFFKTFCF